MKELEENGNRKEVLSIGKQVKDEILIAALITCPTVKEAAKKAGVGETTLHNRKKNPEFQKKYREACVDLVKDHAAAMQIAMGEAVEVLKEVMKDKGEKGAVRASAAEAVLRNGMKITDQANILERLDELKERLGLTE